MRILSVLLPVAALLPVCVSTSQLIGDPKVVGFEIRKERVKSRDHPRLARRQANATVSASLTNTPDLEIYTINVTVGTPGQLVSLAIATASSDLWFPTTAACNSDPEICYDSGYFDSNSSSTFVNLTAEGKFPGFSIAYADSTNAKGSYISDVLGIGSIELSNLTMAGASSTTSTYGHMGLGYQSDESINNGRGSNQIYPNVVNVLKTEGFIDTLVYSLWLNDPHATTGSILFGGIDNDRFYGSLAVLPVETDPSRGIIDNFRISLSGVSVTWDAETFILLDQTQPPLFGIIEPATNGLLLPETIVNATFAKWGVEGNYIACDRVTDAALYFNFGGPNGANINVTLAELITPVFDDDGSPSSYPNGSQLCEVEMYSTGKKDANFGNHFLRSAYVVFDLQNNRVGIAPTVFNATSSNVQAGDLGKLPLATGLYGTSTSSMTPVSTAPPQTVTVTASVTPTTTPPSLATSTSLATRLCESTHGSVTVFSIGTVVIAVLFGGMIVF